MPEFDVTRPSPDAGHEAIRVAVVQAIEDLGFSFDLADTLFLLLDSVYSDLADAATDRGGLARRVAALEASVADLTTRLVALENPRVL